MTAQTRAAVLTVAVAAGLGAGLFMVAEESQAALQAWVKVDPAPRLRLALGALGVAVVVPALAFATYLWRQAADRGRWLRAGAAGLGLAALLSAWFLWRLASLIR